MKQKPRVTEKRAKWRQRSQRLSNGLDDFRARSTRILQFSTYEVEDTNDAPSVERSEETPDLDSHDKTTMESEQFEDVTRGMNFILAPDIVQEIMDRLNDIGPTPLIKRLPTLTRKRIRRSDHWYSEIFHSIFDEASKYTRDTNFDDGPFTKNMWSWIFANSQQGSRQAILEILLHPHIRSFRVRAALGKRDWQYLVSDLGCGSLDKDALDVAATYFLYGRSRDDSSRLKGDLAYVGKAAALTFRELSCGVGACRRLREHREIIRRRKDQRVQKKDYPSNCLQEATGPGESKTLWAHARLAHEDIESLSYCLLSVFPFLGYHDRMLLQFHFLLALAEAIDIIYLGTLDFKPLQDPKRWGVEFGTRIRPSSMPNPSFEGLNRALPTRQGIPLYGFGRVNWSPEEIITVMDVFKLHQSRAYRATGIDWIFVEAELQKNGVDKTRAQLQLLYRELVACPEFSLESQRSRRYKNQWLKIYQLKSFLEERKLVIPPYDEKDNYYHIPGLENGTKTFFEFVAFLQQQGFGAEESCTYGFTTHQIEMSPGNGLRSFGARILPAMLLKEVWEQIKQTPPSCLSMPYSIQSRYLKKRIRQVVLHNIWKGVFGEGHPSTETAFMSRYLVQWPFFLDVWHESSAQLLLDGVPAEHILIGGVLDVINIWDWYKKKPDVQWDSLPKWAYDPTRDIHNTTSKDDVANAPLDGSPSKNLFDSEISDSEGHESDDESLSSSEDFEDLNDTDTPYIWPSDTHRFKALAYSSLLMPRAATVDQNQGSVAEDSTMIIDLRTPNPIIMGQHQVSTLRVLVRLLREVHKEVFDRNVASLSENDFWRNVWYRLDETWGIASYQLLKERFSWVLEYIRIGTMPDEVLCFKNALGQIWGEAGAILRSAKHPYNYNVRCAAGYFNPDLYPRWVELLMGPDDITSKVLTRLSDSYGFQISPEKIYGSYGIVIADLWEDSYAQGLLEDNETFGENKQPSGYSTCAVPSEVPSEMWERNAEIEEVILQELQKKRLKTARSQMEQTRCRNLPQWTAQQCHWIAKEAKNETSWSDMVRPFNSEFKAARTCDDLKNHYQDIVIHSDRKIPDENRPEWAKTSQFVLTTTLICGMTGESHHPPARPWTQEQDNLLREWRSRNISLKAISHNIEQKFGSYRTVQALQGRLNILRKQQPEDNINLQHSNSWHKDQIDWLRMETCGKRKINWKDLGVQFQARFGFERNYHSLDSKLRIIQTGKSTTNEEDLAHGNKLWTGEQLDWIRNKTYGKARNNWKYLALEFKKTFGFDRSARAMQCKMGNIRHGKIKDGKGYLLGGFDLWTKEQMDWLQAETHGKERVPWAKMAIQFKTQFGIDRSADSLYKKSQRSQ